MAEFSSQAGQSPGRPIELSFPLPNAPQTKIHLRLTISATSILLLLTTVYAGEASAKPALGSFVYALPDRINPGRTLCTHIYTYESSIDFTTLMASLLARKTKRPVYVGNSMSFASAGLGGTVEEEMEGFKKVVEVVMAEVNASSSTTNGSTDDMQWSNCYRGCYSALKAHAVFCHRDAFSPLSKTLYTTAVLHAAGHLVTSSDENWNRAEDRKAYATGKPATLTWLLNCPAANWATPCVWKDDGYLVSKLAAIIVT